MGLTHERMSVLNNHFEETKRLDKKEHKHPKPKLYQGPWYNLFVINMNNKFYHIFQFFLTLICTFSSFMYAFDAAFRYDVEFESVEAYLNF